jgi:hypothetical protein
VVFFFLESPSFIGVFCYIELILHVRDRPFNLKGGLWFFVSFRIFFSNNTRVRIFIFFCSAKREFFFQNATLGYMTKTLNQIISFFLHQNQNIFFSNMGNKNIFLEKNHKPPFKLNGRSLRFTSNDRKLDAR